MRATLSNLPSKHNPQEIKAALATLETERVWDRLRDRYYAEWLECDPKEWPVIRLKLDMVKDLREVLRSMSNKRD